MTVRLAAGAVAVTCSVFLLASCSGGSGSSAEQKSSPAAAATSTTSAAGSTSSAPSTPAAGGSSSSAGATTKESTAAAKITIKDFKYQVPTTVKPGQKITITNSDNVNHTVTSDKDGGFDVIVDSNGGTKTFTAPTKPGKYPFHCTYHANMHGTLVVS